MTLVLSPLYPILDAGFLPADRALRAEFLARWAVGLAECGVTVLQYRNKTGTMDEVLSDAAILRRAIEPGSAMRLILNDYPALVAETGFDGVHVGQEDAAPAAVRALVGGEKIVGVSTHNPAQVRLAEAAAPDYIAIGPVFATVSKERPDPVVGLDGVRAARELTGRPLVAIGGITAANCAAVLGAGADAVAVISALFSGPPGFSPAKSAKDFFVNFR